MIGDDVYTYAMDGKMYINLTNRCTNNCEFCIRRGSDGIGGHDLWIKMEPTAEQVVEELGDLSGYDEVVFCGYGEPTIRLSELLKIASYAKSRGKKVRLDTNGQAGLIHKRNVAPEFEGKVDTISISLNASTSGGYDEICHSDFGPKAYDALLVFAKEAKQYVPEVIFSVVDTIGEAEIKKCRTLANVTGVPLRVRKYIQPER